MKSRLSLKSGSSGNSCGTGKIWKQQIELFRAWTFGLSMTFHDFPKQQIIMAGPYPKDLTNVRNMVFSLDSVMRDSSCAGHNFTWTV